jgi:TPM domain
MTGRGRLGASVLLVSLMTISVLATMATAHAQRAGDCGVHRGLVCEGLFTDEPDLVADPQRIADAIARVIEANDAPFAVVIARDSRGMDPAEFAAELADAWGVGDPEELDGVLVLVSIDERRTEVVTQPGIDLPGSAIANAGRSFFAAGDFEGGVLAIIGAVDQALAGGSPGTPGVPGDQPTATPTRGAPAVLIGIVILAAAGVGGSALIVRRNARRARVTSARARRIDALVAGLEPRGDEIELIRTYAVDRAASGDVSTAEGLSALFALDAGRGADPPAAVIDALASLGAIHVLDADRLIAGTRVPLELRAGGERAVLEAGLEGAIDAAASVDPDDDAAFEVALMDLERVIASLRPHRVAAARRRSADALVDHLVMTSAGSVYPDHLATLLMRAAPVLDGATDLADAVRDVRTAHALAAEKVDRVSSIRDRLGASRTSDVASIALADLSNDPDRAMDAYDAAVAALEAHGQALASDGVSLPAVAALLVLNNSAADIPAFVSAYRTLRSGASPAVALEGAVAGLYSLDDLSTARATARDLGIPLAVAVALARRRDDGPVVYRRILGEVSAITDADDASVIAGVLAISVEPGLAMDRWHETRTALGALGLSGAYADVAAAFGASDPRGPRAFALAYAAQRSALEDRGLGSLTRYAPELAHEGTSRGNDTWTGRPLGPSAADFDPFTLFYLHWAATRGLGGGGGWESLYTSPSWHDGGSRWWGGGGGFGGAGGATWTSGGGPFGGASTGGGFGGFGGGGGFSSSGGGGW